MIVARAPLRISFGGGGTDLPAYADRFGGMVVSAAIDPACHASIVPHEGSGVVVQSHDYDLTIEIPFRRQVAIHEPLSLPRAVVAWFAVRGLFPSGIRITLRADVPPGSGLGSSSAMTVAVVRAIARHVALPLTQRMAAEIACEIEIDLLCRPIGRQDHFASAFGGLNTLTFSREEVAVAPMAMSAPAEQVLHDHLLLVSTRRTRDSAAVLRDQRAASGSDGDVTRRLHRLKELASAMRVTLLLGDLPGFGALLHESWQLKRGLAQGVSSREIDHWYDVALCGGAYGGKIAGAGGGGFFLFCVSPDRRANVIADLQAAGLTLFPFRFDHQGSIAWATEPVRATSYRSVVEGFVHETASASASA
ncbi:MAG: GHMP kinase [Chloroflexia bacterium]|nr:GHMP kinase [Chloroflexia bacterium]